MNELRKKQNKLAGQMLANASSPERVEADFYGTPQSVTEALIDFLKLSPKKVVFWECACGKGHMSKDLEKMGYKVIATNLEDQGFGETGIDFTEQTKTRGNFIITNPPFFKAQSFIETALKFNMPFAFVFKSQFWHAASRRELFFLRKPKYVLPLTWRPNFTFGKRGRSPTMEVLWTVWNSVGSVQTIYFPLAKP